MSKKSSKKKKRSGQKSRASLTTAPRNPYANHPLMRKGGTHQKSKSAERAKNRRETRQLARDWASSIKLIASFFLFSFISR